MLTVALGAAIATLARSNGQDDLSINWQHAIGDPAERLLADAAAMPRPAELVALPHRVHLPNRSLWYSRTLIVPPATALVVDADDGAQVFADGVQLSHYRRWFFVPDSAVSTRHIVVRVLNNAMQGGLRSVRMVAAGTVTRESLDAPALAKQFPPVETGAFRRRMPGPGEPCRFTAWADSQGGWETFGRLVALMPRRRPHFSLGIGDLVTDGSDARGWRSFADVLAPAAARVPIVAVAGNHDYDGQYNDLRPRHYLDVFRPGLPTWFAWSCGAVRFAAIDMNAEFPIGLSAVQHAWLMDQVRSREWTEAGFRVLAVHQPPWSRSWAGYDGDQSVRDIVTALTASHGLDLVISGHSHAFERMTRTAGGRTVHVLITGGAGGGLEAPLSADPPGAGTIVLKHHFVAITASPGTMAFEAVGLDGQSFDRWRISR